MLQTDAAKQAGVLHQLTGDDCSERSFLPIETAARQRARRSPWRPGRAALEYHGVSLLQPPIRRPGRDRGHRLVGPVGGVADASRRRAHAPSGRHGKDPPRAASRRADPQPANPAYDLERRSARGPQPVPPADAVPLRAEAGRPAAGSCRLPVNASTVTLAAGRTGPPRRAKSRPPRSSQQVGCDYHWLDAAWFPGGFPNGVGNWFCDPKKFPNGLKPVSDACHQLGLKFIFWFEPERVAKGTQIAQEHPEFVFGGDEGGLFKLGDPAARRWLTDLLSQRIDRVRTGRLPQRLQHRPAAVSGGSTMRPTARA